jgi:heat shock protein HslJ
MTHGTLRAQAQDLRAITGEVIVLEKIALPDTTVLIVDVTALADGSRTELRVSTNGAQAPFAFALDVPANAPLVLRAGLRAEGDTVWLTEPLGIESGTDALVLNNLRATRTPVMGFSTLLQCGTQLVEIGFLPEEVRLRFNEQLISLQPQPTASGALYVAADNPATSIHLKGSSALLTVDGAELSECRMISPEQDITTGIWNISAIDEKPAIFPSRTELAFFPDGRVSASVGCNRLMGAYRRHGGFLSFGRIASTRMACSDGLGEQETLFRQALERVDGYILGSDGTRLTLTALGKPVLQARR